jgi:glycosyltransferase involved in cell wall biosynthesis
MSLKIGLITRIFLPHIGGIETLTLDIAKGLIEIGVKVKVLTSRFDNVLPKEEVMDNIYVKRYNIIKLGRFSLSLDLLQNPDTNLDIAHFISCYPSFFNLYGVPFYRAKGINIVYTTIWPIPLTFNLYRKHYIKKMMGWFYDNALLRKLLSMSDAIVTLTRGEAENYRRLLGNKVPVYVIPEAVEPPRAIPPSVIGKVRDTYGIREDDLVIGIVGRVVRYKRIDLALKVLKLLNKRIDAKLLVIGPIYDAEYYMWLIEMAKTFRLKNNVIFTGKVDFEVRDALYNVADVLIHTSEYEAFVRPALEGWRYKKPIVSFNLSPASDFIEEEKGGLVTRRWGDYAEMATLIEEIVRKNLIEELGENGYRALMRKYTKDKIALAYLKIYKEVLQISSSG